MEPFNTFFGNWFEYQNKLLENWLETTNRMSKMYTENAQMAKFYEVYKEWVDQQNSLFSEMNGVVKRNNESMMTDFMKDMLKKQQEFNAKWFDLMKNMLDKQFDRRDWLLGESDKQFRSWLDIYFNWYKD